MTPRPRPGEELAHAAADRGPPAARWPRVCFLPWAGSGLPVGQSQWRSGTLACCSPSLGISPAHDQLGLACDPYAPALQLGRIGVAVTHRGLGPAQAATLVVRGMATARGPLALTLVFSVATVWGTAALGELWAGLLWLPVTLLVNLPLLATVGVYLALLLGLDRLGRRPPGHAPLLLGLAQPSSRGRTPPDRDPTSWPRPGRCVPSASHPPLRGQLRRWLSSSGDIVTRGEGPSHVPAADEDPRADRSRQQHYRGRASTGAAGGRARAGGLGVGADARAYRATSPTCVAMTGSCSPGTPP
jgi:hypothetical protein